MRDPGFLDYLLQCHRRFYESRLGPEDTNGQLSSWFTNEDYNVYKPALSISLLQEVWLDIIMQDNID